jgi:hypothetical protein
MAERFGLIKKAQKRGYHQVEYINEETGEVVEHLYREHSCRFPHHPDYIEFHENLLNRTRLCELISRLRLVK